MNHQTFLHFADVAQFSEKRSAFFNESGPEQRPLRSRDELMSELTLDQAFTRTQQLQTEIDALFDKVREPDGSARFSDLSLEDQEALRAKQQEQQALYDKYNFGPNSGNEVQPYQSPAVRDLEANKAAMWKKYPNAKTWGDFSEADRAQMYEWQRQIEDIVGIYDANPGGSK
jgi:hypothetical protein